jgi:WD40 repeat protein
MARFGTIILALAAPLILQAQEDLPDGAIARLGSTRFRHVGWITAIAYSPDGRELATGCIDGHLRMWDVATGRLSWKADVGALVTSVAISPDGHLVSAGGFRGWRGGRTVVEVWKAASGETVHSFDIGAYGARAVAFSPDGKTLAIGTGVPGGGFMQILPPEASFIELRDLETGSRVRKIPVHERGVTSMAFSADGETLFTTGEGRDLLVTDVSTGKAVRVVAGAGDRFAPSPDGKLLASRSSTSTLRISDASTGETIRDISTEASHIHSLAFSPDGRWLAATASGLHVLVWDVGSWTVTGTVHLPLRSGIPEGYQPLAYPLAFSPDGRTLAVGSNDHVPHFIDPGKREEATRPDGHRAYVVALAFSPDGEVLASTGGDGAILLWSVSRRRLLQVIDAGDPSLHALAFSPDGTLLAAGGTGDRIRTFRMPGGTQAARWQLDKADRPAPMGPAFGDPSGSPSVQGVAFSPDGMHLFASTSDGWVYGMEIGDADVRILARRATRTPTPQILRAMAYLGSDLLDRGPWSEAWRKTLCIGPEGDFLAFQADNRTVRIVGVPDGKFRDDLQVPEWNREPSALGVLPDGGVVITGNRSGEIRLWEVATGKTIRHWTSETVVVTSLDVSGDGSLIAWSGPGTRIRLWRLGSRQPSSDLTCSDPGTLSVVFSPDGEILASAGLDGTITLWGMETPDGKSRSPGKPIPTETMEKLWESLALGDASRADRAIRTLAHAPEEVLFFLEGRFRPAPGVDLERVRILLERLDADEFHRREAATRELADLGPAIEDELVAASDRGVSPEVQSRLERVLSTIRPPIETFPSEVLRRIRTIRALEMMGTPAAASLLRSYAARSHSEREKRHIEAALRRMGIPREF